MISSSVVVSMISRTFPTFLVFIVSDVVDTDPPSSANSFSKTLSISVSVRILTLISSLRRGVTATESVVTLETRFAETGGYVAGKR